MGWGNLPRSNLDHKFNKLWGKKVKQSLAGILHSMEKILHIALGGVNWMRTFQTLQMDGSGCFALPTFVLGFTQQQRGFQTGSEGIPGISSRVNSWKTASRSSSFSTIIRIHQSMEKLWSQHLPRVSTGAGEWTHSWSFLAILASLCHLSVIPTWSCFPPAGLGCSRLALLCHRTMLWVGREIKNLVPTTLAMNRDTLRKSKTKMEQQKRLKALPVMWKELPGGSSHSQNFSQH